MEKISHLRVISALVLVSSLLSSLLFSTPARAESVLEYTSLGKVITVGVCLPSSVKSPIYLQTYENHSIMKTHAKISFSKLQASSKCNSWLKSPANEVWGEQKIVGKRSYLLTYRYRVSFSGERVLAFYAPNLKLLFDGWPDVVVSEKATPPKPTESRWDAFLNEPAADYFIPGSALTTLQQLWGISLNGASGPKTFGQVADEIYIYLNRSVGGNLSASDLEISFQYGNSMQVFFSRLIDNVWAYQAMKDRLIYNANL
jgi:hypothetical protein